MNRVSSRIAALAALVVLPSCTPEPGELPLPLEVSWATVEGDDRPWTEAVWLGPVINSAAHERIPRLSHDGLSLYFHSDRPGGLGGTDLWVSRRTGPGCAWQSPLNLGLPLNTAAGDGDFAFAPGGRMAFYTSGGHGGFGDTDIFVTHRIGPAEQELWAEPVNLGPGVNTAAHETSSWYLQTGPGGGVLYFNRDMDIWSVPVRRDGSLLGPAAPVTELNLPIADGAVTLGSDGRELIFWSGGAAGLRPGSLGLADLWISTRPSVTAPWSEPRNLGPTVNGPFPDLFPGLSWDGRTLFFSSQRPGGLGRNDLWMSTRAPAGAGPSVEECAA